MFCLCLFTIRKQTQTKQIHNMCWTPLYVNKHKLCICFVCVCLRIVVSNTYCVFVLFVFDTTIRCPTHIVYLFCLCLFTYSGVQHIQNICFVCVCLRIVVSQTKQIHNLCLCLFTYSGVQHIQNICFVCVCLRIMVSNTYCVFVLFVFVYV